LKKQYVIFTETKFEIVRKKMKTERKIVNEMKQKNLCNKQRRFLVSVLGEGLEPSRTEVHRILSPVRLPIPPSEHSHLTEKEYKISYIFHIRKIFLQKITSLKNNTFLNMNLNYLVIKNVY
jgi:hypothetical protein